MNIIAMRKAKAEQEYKEKLSKINVLGSEIAEVPTLYAKGEPRTGWISPVPLVKTTITKTKKDGWGIEKKVKMTAWKHDWDDWEPQNEEVNKTWAALDEILDGKRAWPKKGKVLLFKEGKNIVCPKCGKQGATKSLLQTRSADEAPTEILTCVSCGYTWRARD